MKIFINKSLFVLFGVLLLSSCSTLDTPDNSNKQIIQNRISKTTITKTPGSSTSSSESQSKNDNPKKENEEETSKDIEDRFYKDASVNANIPLYQEERAKQKKQNKDDKFNLSSAHDFIAKEREIFGLDNEDDDENEDEEENNETLVSPTEENLSKEEIKELIKKLEEGKEYKTSSIINDYVSDSKEGKSAKLLMQNYKNILNVSSVCCLATTVSKLKDRGIRGNNLINLLKNDAKNYFLQDTCLIVSDNDINTIYGKKYFMAQVFKETRSNCICNNQNELKKNIKNFYKVYDEDKNFYKTKLIYAYKDKQNRNTEHDINESISNITHTLNNCPVN